ncbi:TPA: LPXTG cell wall anchor domain-containing protein [Enterococcus faecalis]|uniref:LPXTG cell wall anchor domain-containing protein n=1 Tax=Enterococcus faecalis TaxID=1351 RepID=UPI001EE3BBFF|nr:LPXTG cell wall anchor domain-containing protein [Enterococcus faecalis]EHB5081922.1 LPXTG cell wall anchor domain-containing protein [Enterococcus faecalis]EKK5287624.1 LPXTG cell wall anchor domain-containing protein [Enterococcus faecalis]MDK7897380.1 LPXTG cell wall anchor domain-containing protein [Enterococcus faecalis]UKU96300.1 LPXTG cell wall anchor domain-containing protein [Enterococcus faecalis]UKU98995.1 LPXTG cell wall anchor domain-containing protein [Enterococcus faecalis]
MKRFLFISLFSTLFLTSGTIVFADEETPTTPSVTEGTKPPVLIPEVPDTRESKPDNPVVVDPGDAGTEKPTDPVTPTNPPVDPEMPTDPITPTDPEKPVDPETPTEPTTPSEPTNPNGTTGSGQSGTSGTTSSGDAGKTGTSETPTNPTDKQTEQIDEKTNSSKTDGSIEQPSEPEKETTVTVTSNGQISTAPNQGTAVPIVTGNVNELTAIPTPATPVKAENGQMIVGMQDGVPLVRDNQGSVVKDLSIPVKKLPSGNVEVKTADGQTKVLPHTGEDLQIGLSILGSLLTVVAGFIFYRKKQWFQWCPLFKKFI